MRKSLLPLAVVVGLSLVACQDKSDDAVAETAPVVTAVETELAEQDVVTELETLEQVAQDAAALVGELQAEVAVASDELEQAVVELEDAAEAFAGAAEELAESAAETVAESVTE